MTTRPGETVTWWGVNGRLPVPRLYPAPVGIAIFLGVLALVFPLLGPATWVFANEHLERVARGFAAHHGVGCLRFARVCGMIGSYAVLAAIAFLIVMLI